MTLRHLKIFVSVYQNNSITKASDELHLAQPSVSLAIKELETYYGIHLFDRISRRLFVTENGKLFYSYALHIVSLFDEMEKEIRNWDSLGSLRIGSSVTIGSYFLPELIAKFRERCPNIEVNVSIHNSATLEQLIMNNSIDFALVEGIPEHPQLKQHPFMDDRLSLICSPNHPMANQNNLCIEDVKNYNFLLRERGSASREILESITTLYQLNINIIWESISNQAIIHGVSKGLGISILPYLLVKESIEKGLIIEKEIENISLTRKFSIIHHKNKYLSKTALILTQMIEKEFQNML